MNNLKLISDQCRLIGFLIVTIEAIRWGFPRAHTADDNNQYEAIDALLDKVKKESHEIMERIQYE